jgi:precorrin-6A synthase
MTATGRSSEAVARITVVGIGLGEADQLSSRAVAALNEIDVFFVLGKDSPADDLARLRQDLCRQVVTGHDYRFVEVADPPRDREAGDYEAAVADWTAARAAALSTAIDEHLRPGRHGGLLAWGDPAFYDSTLRVLDALRRPVDLEVIPGVSSIQALAAAHGVSLTRVGRPLLLTTGRRLSAEGMPPGFDDVVVLLDGEAAFRRIDPAGVRIYWGAHLGGPDQVLVAGDLAEVSDRIVEARRVARARRGWVMDTYLLRR